ncbi:MAG: GNAT family N-acetyltransferase [Bacteroidota bacterium]|nr:GNAT family N-acetyltransferase [Bacteroidota bacterium]
MIIIRPAQAADHAALLELYKAVAALPVGIARAPEEVTPAYIHGFMQSSADRGIQLVAVDEALPGTVLGDIHCERPAAGIFRHVFSNLTIAVHPAFHAQGIGKKLFTTLLQNIEATRPDILRVELFVQASNEKAQSFYLALGFKEEGRFEKKVWGKHGILEDDVAMAWLNPAFTSGKR